MKKALLTGALIVAAFTAVSAQDADRVAGTTTKSGREILPKAGDFALSVDATPLLKYVGGFFSTTGADADNLFQQDLGIAGQYFLTDNRSVRARLQMSFPSVTVKTFVPKDGSTTGETVENSISTSSSDFQIGLGYVFHRGYGRLQAFYGPQINIGFGRGQSITREYGNPLTATNPYSRMTEDKDGMNFNIGAGGFIGVEFFVAPKLSVGGEFGLGLSFASKGEGSRTTEEWDGAAIKTTTTNTAGGSSFNFATQTYGSLSVNFYF